MITTIYTCSPKRDYLNLSHIYSLSTHSLLAPECISVLSLHPSPLYSHNIPLPRIGDLENSASIDCTSQTQSSHFYPSSSSPSPSVITRIFKHSLSHYTKGDYSCKYYSIAFAILTRIAGGLAQELIKQKPVLLNALLAALVALFFCIPDKLAAAAFLRQPVTEGVKTVPFAFIRNQGQVDRQVQYYINGAGSNIYFTKGGVTLDFVYRERGPALLDDDEPEMSRGFKRYAFSMNPVNPGRDVRLEGVQRLAAKVSYLKSDKESKWLTDVPGYERMVYRDVYKGIDLLFYGREQMLNYDFIVRPFADPSKIMVSFQGVDGIRVDREGNLVISTPVGDFVQRKPFLYQVIDGKRVQVDGRFKIHRTKLGERFSGFNVGDYDPSHELVIDPALVFSTYIGGNGADWIRGIAMDSEGYIYIAGGTSAGNFPTTVGAFQEKYSLNQDIFVAKITPDAGSLVYATYVGGNQMDYAYKIALTGQGNACITGLTKSEDFPIKVPYQETYGGGDTDAFVTKLTSDGSGLEFSSYLGGSGADWGRGIEVDASGMIYVMGDTTSTDYPTEVPYQSTNHGERDIFVAKMSTDGTKLIFSTYLGGSNHDWGRGATLDSAGNIYITGGIWSEDFPTVNPLQSSQAGVHDILIAKLSSDGQELLYSTYYGGSNSERGRSIVLDSDGNIYITGPTWSQNFPVKNAYQAKRGDNGGNAAQDAFVMKLSPNGQSVIYATYLGGTSSDEANDVTCDSEGNAYVTGDTSSSDFPTTSGAYDTTFGGNIEGEYGNTDVFFTEYSADGQKMLYSTYLGGAGDDRGYEVLLDNQGGIVIAGGTTSTDFPVTSKAYDTGCGGDGTCNNGEYGDGFIAKLDITAPYPVFHFPENNESNVPVTGISITVIFSEDMALSTITADNFYITDSQGQKVQGVVSYGSSTKTASFTPSSDLTASSNYTVTVKNEITDFYENPMSESVIWSFTTEVTPTSSPVVCEAESMTLSSTNLELNENESGEVTVTVTGAENCPSEGEEVKVKIKKKNKKKVSVSSTTKTTDSNGQATFAFTAKKTGKVKATFKAGKLKKKSTVKITS